MAFPEHERQAMRALHGVGDSVIARLEQLGYQSLAQLRDSDEAELCRQIALMLRSSCWSNSPQARAAIGAVIRLARQQDGG